MSEFISYELQKKKKKTLNLRVINVLFYKSKFRNLKV